MTPPAFDWRTQRRAPVRAADGQVWLAETPYPPETVFDCGAAIGPVPAAAVVAAQARVAALTAGECRPQLAALVYAVTGCPRALDHYFPLARTLPPAEQAAFDALLADLFHNPRLVVRLFGPGRADLTAQLPADARAVVAGHLAETFFYRRDVLDRLLSAPRHVRLYTTRAAYTADGGEAGGSFHAERGAVQLVLARLYEGFNGDYPGVAPFLHELGHLLDFVDIASGHLGGQAGLLPGLSPRDGAVFNAQARALFLRGKALERACYAAYAERQAAGAPDPAAPLPIGHPYVFQNDAEFCAGYFEMFFRNPHYLAAHNRDLHAAYVALFGYDPRRCWPRDFSFYIEQNQAFYRSGQTPGPLGITE
jgi:hypothetical protein